MNRTPAIHFISDFGLGSHYTTAIRATLFNEQLPYGWNELCTNVPVRDTYSAAFTLHAALQSLPQGDVIFIAINQTYIHEQPNVYVALINGLTIISTNLQVLQLALAETDAVFYAYPFTLFTYHAAFPEKDVLVQTLKHILTHKAQPDFKLDIEPSALSLWTLEQPNERLIKANIIHVDNYQNAITNLRKHTFDTYNARFSTFSIIYSRKYRITKLDTNYAERSDATVVALFNHLNLLEISMINGEASPLLGLKVGKHILIEFYD
jgi:S-adenosylmethionine hydrolase